MGSHKLDCICAECEKWRKDYATPLKGLRPAEPLSVTQGHDEPCYFCKEKCDSLSANPGRWPIPLCHSDEPGKVKWHHVGCISDRLEELHTLQNRISFLEEAINIQSSGRRVADSMAAAERKRYEGTLELLHATEDLVTLLAAENKRLKNENRS